MKIIFEFDDLHWKSPENCLSTIEYLVERVPNIKLSFFCTPQHSNLPLSLNDIWCEKIKKFIDSKNINLYVHGLNHESCEFLHLSEEEALIKLIQAHEEFKKANLTFYKVFRAPYWNINENTYKALQKLNYSHIYSHEDYKDLSENQKIKTIFYNWNLKDEFKFINHEIIIAHGHTHNTCSNGIFEVKDRIVEFCQKENPEFIFAHEI